MSDASNLPPDRLPARQTLDQMLQTALKDILKPAQQKQVFERLRPRLELIVQSSSTFHSGPLPSVETVKGYETVAPGSFERILAMAEKDQTAVIESSNFKAKKDSAYRTLAMVLGFGALLCILGSVLYLAFNGRESVAIAVAGLGAAGVITAFVNARFPSKG